MRRRQPQVGDHENTDFEIIDEATHRVKPGFDSGEERGEPQEGEHRFPHRRSEADVPSGPLSERLRGREGKGD